MGDVNRNVLGTACTGYPHIGNKITKTVPDPTITPTKVTMFYLQKV